MKILFVDGCSRVEAGLRLEHLCKIFLREFCRIHPDYVLETLILEKEKLSPLLPQDLDRREELILAGELSHPMFAYARQFAEADRILIGAPYPDLFFPSPLQVYMQYLYAQGITFVCEDNTMAGNCRAQKLLLLQTAGSYIAAGAERASYLYTLCGMFGIPEMRSICAEGIDVKDADRDAIWQHALSEAFCLAGEW